MNPVTRIVSSAALPMLPIALALLLTVTPSTSAAAQAQSLREAGKALAQEKSCQAQALESLRECEAEEAEEEKEKADGVPDRSGLGWAGIGLLSAGGALAVSASTVDRWRACGPPYNQRKCRDIERRHGISGGALLATGLTFLIIDEVRRHPEPYSGASRPSRQTAIAIGPRAIQVRMLF